MLNIPEDPISTGTLSYTMTSTKTAGTRILVVPICPDLLDYSAIGAADNLRGKVVRLFFYVMRIWPT